MQKYGPNRCFVQTELIEKLERSLDSFGDVNRRVNRLREQLVELERKCWTHESVSIKEEKRCDDGTIIKFNHVYSKYILDEKSFNDLDRYYYILKETIANDHVFGRFHQNYHNLRLELTVYELVEITREISSQIADTTSNESGESDVPSNCRIGKEHLLEWITVLFRYYCKSSSVTVNQQLKDKCYQSLIILSNRLLKIASLEDRLFLLNHALRCPPSTSPWLAPYMAKCPDPLPHKHSNYELGKSYVDLASTVLATILSPLSTLESSSNRIKSSNSNAENQSQTDHKWLMVDSDYEDEVISLNQLELTELDLINYLHQVPFDQMLSFVSLLPGDVHDAPNRGVSTLLDVQSVESSMIKLFAFNTRLIRILRIGLQQFNCLRYKHLIRFISSMIQRIMLKTSSNWSWCKEGNFEQTDLAMMARLQVEYDYFMLRSIMTILSTKRRGMWPILSRIQFTGLSESMLWHILWAVYSNDFEQSGDVGSNGNVSLCSYMSFTYWKDKFAEHNQWKYVFVKRISSFSQDEATGFLEFLYSMAISAPQSDSLFLHEIITKISEICLIKSFGSSLQVTIPSENQSQDSNSSNSSGNNPVVLIIENHHFYLEKGLNCIARLLETFKSCIGVLLHFLEHQTEESNIIVDQCHRLFQAISFHDFVPSEKLMNTLYQWLIQRDCNSVYNQISRCILGKLPWNQTLVQTDHYNCLLLNDKMQKEFALKLYHAHLEQQRNNQKTEAHGKDKKVLTNSGVPVSKLSNAFIELAFSSSLEEYTLWTWSVLFRLRVQPLTFLPEESAWDEIVHGPGHLDNLSSSLRNDKNLRYKQHRIFQHLPQINYDAELVPLLKGVQESKHPLALYIATLMTDLVLKSNDSVQFLDICSTLSTSGHHLAVLHLLKYFVPLMYQTSNATRVILPTDSSGSTKSVMPTLFQANPKLLYVVVNLLGNGYASLLCSLVLFQIKHFVDPKHAVGLCTFWTEVLVGSIDTFSSTTNSNSWLSSLNPFAGSGGSLVSVDEYFNSVVSILDRVSQRIVHCGEACIQLYVKYLLDRTSDIYQSKENSIKPWKMNFAGSVDNPPVTPNSTKSRTFTSFLFSPLSGSSAKQFQYLPDKNVLKSEWITPLHILIRFNLNSIDATLATSSSRQPALFLAFLVILFDVKRFDKIWDHLVFDINTKELANDDTTAMAVDYNANIKDVCDIFQLPPVPLELLPINSLLVWLLKSAPYPVPTHNSTQASLNGQPHPMTPLLWKVFFVQFFSNTDSSRSIGLKLLSQKSIDALKEKLTNLFDYHGKQWLLMNNEKTKLTSRNDNNILETSSLLSNILFEDRLTKLYQSFRLWLTDMNLHNAFINFDEERYQRPEFQSSLLKYILAESTNKSGTLSKTSFSNDSKSNNYFFLNFTNRQILENGLIQDESVWSQILDNPKVPVSIDFNDKSVNDIEDLLRLLENFRVNANVLPMQDDPLLQMAEWQYKPILDFFNTLSHSLNVDLLLNDSESMYFYVVDGHDRKVPEVSTLIVIVHQIMDTIIDEAKSIQSLMEKYGRLNKEFCIDLLPNLYHDVQKSTNQVICCEQVAGCTGPARFEISFSESVQNEYINQKYNSNRFALNEILDLSQNFPSLKTIGLVYFLRKVCNQILRHFDGMPTDNSRQKLKTNLFKPLAGWLKSINSVEKYLVANQVLDQYLDTLNQLSNVYLDEVNCFLVETVLDKDMNVNMIQQLAPNLSPSKCSPSVFIQMYKMIGSNIKTVPHQTLFVLLSKFDTSSWLQSSQVTDAERFNYLECLFTCLTAFGQYPSNESLVTFDLYRRHLQNAILHQFPKFLPKILEFLLDGMRSQVIAPCLWNNVVHTFGFYTKTLSNISVSGSYSNSSSVGSQQPVSNRHPLSVLDFDYGAFDADLRDFVERQHQGPIFTSHELFDLLGQTSKFFACQTNLTTELLDFYKVYSMKYLQFLSFMSFNWIKENSSSSSGKSDF